MISGLNIVFVTLILAISAALHGAIGYGMALLANPILMMIDPNFVPGPMLFNSLILSMLVVFRERVSFNLEGLHWAVVGRLAGAIFAAWLLAIISPHLLVVIFAVLVLMAVLITASGLRIPINRMNLLVTGTMAGIMGTVASIGGPPMALVFQHESGAKMRTSLAGFFIAGSLFSLVALWMVGRFGMGELRLGVLMAPGTLLGYFLSSRILSRLSPKALRIGVLSIATISALVILLQEISQAL